MLQSKTNSQTRLQGQNTNQPLNTLTKGMNPTSTTGSKGQFNLGGTVGAKDLPVSKNKVFDMGNAQNSNSQKHQFNQYNSNKEANPKQMAYTS